MQPERLVTLTEIKGAIAFWAVAQHPYRDPPGLGAVLTALDAIEMRDSLPVMPAQWFGGERAVERWLRSALFPQRAAADVLERWNTPQSGHDLPFVESSRYGGPAPEDDFIDLDAFFRNVARMVWERAADYHRPVTVSPRRWKRVLRWDPSWPKLRLFRVTWDVGTVGDGSGYSRKVAVALRPRLFRFERSHGEWRAVVLGIEIHSHTSWGGRCA